MTRSKLLLWLNKMNNNNSILYYVYGPLFYKLLHRKKQHFILLVFSDKQQ